MVMKKPIKCVLVPCELLADVCAGIDSRVPYGCRTHCSSCNLHLPRQHLTSVNIRIMESLV